MIQINVETLNSYMTKTGHTQQDICEMCDVNCNDILYIFYTQTQDDIGSFVGIQVQDGSCAVYGCDVCDCEYITLGKMLEILLDEWEM